MASDRGCYPVDGVSHRSSDEILDDRTPADKTELPRFTPEDLGSGWDYQSDVM